MTALTKITSLNQNVAWSFFGNLIYAGAQWGVLIVIAKLGGPRNVGLLTLGLAIAAPIFMFTNLQLRALQSTDIKQNYLFSEYFGLRLATSVLTLTFLVSYAAIVGTKDGWIVAVVGLTKTIEAVSDIVSGLFQRHEKYQRIAINLFIKGGCSVLVVGIFFYISDSLLTALIAMSVIWLAILLFIELPAAMKLSISRPAFNISRFLSIFKVAFPLGISMMLISLQTNVVRYILEYYEDTVSVGIFGALSYLVVAGGMMVNSMGQAASPRLARYWHEGSKDHFIKTIKMILLSAVTIGVFAIVLSATIGEKALRLLYSDEFASYNDVLVILMIGALMFFVASILGYVLTATRTLTQQPLLFALVAFVACLSSLILIPKFGIYGAAWATVIIFGTQMFGSAYLLRTVIRKM